MNNRYYIYKSKRREVDKIQFRDDKIFVSYLPMTKKNINYYCELKQASSYTDFGFEITKDIATCIITGIITDTGGFAYSGVTAETFEFAASLLKRGVNVSDVYKRVLQTTTKPCFELTRIALNRLEFLENGKISFTYITEEDMQKANAETGDHEGIVTIGRNIEGVEVSVFARQIDEGWRLSLRSNDYVNVSDVCIMFGGGGHPKAAGATLTGSINEVKDKILAQIKRYIRN